MNTPPPTSRLYQFYRLLIVPALLWYVWVAHYAVTASMGKTIEHARWGIFLSVFVATPLSMIVGFLIMRRLPGNVIGPALIVSFTANTSEAIHALVLPASQASLNEFALWTVVFTTQLILLSHFPTGTLHPRRVAPVLYLLIGLALMAGFGNLLADPLSYGTELAYEEALPNPFFIHALEPITSIIQALNDPVLFVTGFGAIILALVRYTQTSAIERKQIRWVMFGFLVTSIGYALPVLFTASSMVLLTTTLSLAVDGFVFPICIGIGILFYGLWDIDVIIRRTFTYSIVSLILVGSYLLIVLASQAVLSTFIDSESSLAVVISTLGVAVLFNPVRERVQRFIDRLFNRKRYDADATLEAFRDDIRNAIEPEAIQGHLVQTISSTIQPATISFWGIECSS
jgi:hypothetical protein